MAGLHSSTSQKGSTQKGAKTVETERESILAASVRQARAARIAQGLSKEINTATTIVNFRIDQTAILQDAETTTSVATEEAGSIVVVEDQVAQALLKL